MAHLSKLTVPQLKALCKAHNLSGYSKLNKDSLIQKIDTFFQSNDAGKSENAPAGQLSEGSGVEIASCSLETITCANAEPGVTEKHILPENPIANPKAVSKKHLLADQFEGPVVKKPKLAMPEPPARRLLVADDASQTFPNGLEDDSTSLAQPVSNLHLLQSSKTSSTRWATASIINSPQVPGNDSPYVAVKLATTANDKKRFKPLPRVPSPRLLETPNAVSAYNLTPVETGLRHFGFISAKMNLIPIKMPPSVSQRKIVHRWALILSGLSDAERRPCLLVSKMIRYAIYLSAATILSIDYGGGRLQEIVRIIPQNVTNMWPYLHLRLSEVATQRKAYVNSFVGKFYKDFQPISPRLFASPDNPKQYEIAVRFIMTKLWFAVSVGSGGGDSAWLYSVVIDAREVVEGEVWSISVLPPGKPIQLVYVLELTCEVIGHHTNTSPGEPNYTAAAPHLRSDWSAYIEERTSVIPSSGSSLLDQIKWANYEEYHRGISRLWLKRISQEGDLGLAKERVAMRYILASVVGNSVSGTWMTLNQMAQQDCSSSAEPKARIMKASKQRVNIFLSAHHHIESVHFVTAAKKPLHPALAVVQTPGREYYVLKDNGMQVGCEEEGVAPVWMEMLNCDLGGTLSSRS